MVIAVIGAQWGDEGKGKIVDLLSERFDIVVRYQGGHNAGHSVQIGDQSFVLHLLPSGVIHSGKTCVLGNGMVIDPKAFFEEADRLMAQGITVTPEIFPWTAEMEFSGGTGASSTVTRPTVNGTFVPAVGSTTPVTTVQR